MGKTLETAGHIASIVAGGASLFLLIRTLWKARGTLTATATHDWRKPHPREKRVLRIDALNHSDTPDAITGVVVGYPKGKPIEVEERIYISNSDAGVIPFDNWTGRFPVVVENAVSFYCVIDNNEDLAAYVHFLFGKSEDEQKDLSKKNNLQITLRTKRAGRVTCSLTEIDHFGKVSD